MARISPEARAHLEAFKAVKVRHPRLEEVDRQVTQMIEEHASATHLLLYGPSGVGKSTVAKRLTERFVAAEPNRAIVPVVGIEARPSDTGVYARLDYYRQVLSGLREHAAVKDRLMQVLYLQTTDNSSGSQSGTIVSFHQRERGRHHGTSPLVLPTATGRSCLHLPPHPSLVL